MIPEAPSTTTIEEPASSGGMTVVLPGQTPEGAYILSVLLKRTYDIVPNGTCSRAETDKPLFTGDVPWGDPLNSTVRFESDFVPFKPATDVVLNGTAYAPDGRPTKSCLVSLQVENVHKQVLVIGDRVARFVKGGVPGFTDPIPFVTMELRYERAYGGIDVYSDKTTSYPYPRNLLGRGFVVANSERAIDKLALPNLEDPATSLAPERLCVEDYRRWEQQPFPAGLGWFPKPGCLVRNWRGSCRPIAQPSRSCGRHTPSLSLPANVRSICNMDFQTWISGSSTVHPVGWPCPISRVENR